MGSDAWNASFLVSNLYSAKKSILESICRTFLWTGGVDKSKKAMVSWDIVCVPKHSGGLNLKHLVHWNKATITKLLWALKFKKDINVGEVGECVLLFEGRNMDQAS